MLKPPAPDEEINLNNESVFSVSEIATNQEEKGNLSEMLRDEYSATECLINKEYGSHIVSQRQKTSQYLETKTLFKALNEATARNTQKEIQLNCLSTLVSELKQAQWGDSDFSAYLEKIEKIKGDINEMNEKIEEELFETERLKTKLEIKRKEMGESKKLSVETADAFKRLTTNYTEIKNAQFLALNELTSAQGQVIQCKNDGENMKESYRRAYDLMLRKKEKVENQYQSLIERITYARMKNKAKKEAKINLINELENGVKEKINIKELSKMNAQNLKTYHEKFKIIEEILKTQGYHINFMNGIADEDTLKIIEGFKELKSHEISLSTMFTELTSQHILDENLCEELKNELELLKMDTDLNEIPKNPMTYNDIRSSLNDVTVNFSVQEAHGIDNLIMKIYYQALGDISQSFKVLGLIKKYSNDLGTNVNEVYEYTSIELPNLRKGSIKRIIVEQLKPQKPIQKPLSRVEAARSRESMKSTATSKHEEENGESTFEEEMLPYLPLSNAEIDEVYLRIFPSEKENSKKFIELLNSIPIIRQLLTEENLINYLKNEKNKENLENYWENIEKNIIILLEEIHRNFKNQVLTLFTIFLRFFTATETSTNTLFKDIVILYKQRYPKKINAFYENLKINMPGGVYKEPRFKKQTQDQMKQRIFITEDTEPISRYRVIEKVYEAPPDQEKTEDLKKSPGKSQKILKRSLSNGLPQLSPTMRYQGIFQEARNLDKRLKDLKIYHKRASQKLEKSASAVTSPQPFMKKISRLSTRIKNNIPQSPQTAQSSKDRKLKKTRFKSAHSSPLNSLSTTAYTVNTSSLII
ncbi:unnamed protein product [Blepharisma stoltei]|uniref:Uncharacterized protein n=1 Tax=Blepharisma stoltei TaxID=1481888 RepID=A0AAU9ISI4_9CILI|nr:unnamed protein product [Blepharisma stoltei]